jgi:hypothetical protein
MGQGAGSRVETGRFQAMGHKWIQVAPPHLVAPVRVMQLGNLGAEAVVLEVIPGVAVQVAFESKI